MTRTEDRLLLIENLTVSVDTHGVKKTVVNEFNLGIERGETIGIVGESGSGKTMTMLALARLLPRQASIASGRIDLEGTELLSLDDANFYHAISGKRVSMIFQEPMTALNPVYAIGHQLTETVMFKDNISQSDANAMAIEMLENVQLPDPKARMRQYPHQLSGGQRQRVMIAMALMNNPDLLIADEPTTALDVTVQDEIIQLLISLQKKFGMAVIFISHDLGVVSRISNRIIVMQHGNVVESGDTSVVLTKPKDEYTKSLLACLWKLEDNPDNGSLSDTNPESLLIDVRNVNKTFKIRSGLFKSAKLIHAVKDASFKVYSGETMAIVGESGSGKSTIAKIINGLLKPDSGEILFEGRPIGEISVKERARLIQPIFQDPYSTLNPKHTIGYIISRPLNIHEQLSPDEVRNKVNATLESVGLTEEFYNRFPNQLSGGQRQRVAIARAIILDPRILICDEPTSALDVSIQEQILDLLRDIQKQRGMTMILISHDMAVVGYLADHVFVIYEGEIVEHGEAEKILKTPSDPYTQRLMDSVYRIPRPETVNLTK